MSGAAVAADVAPVPSASASTEDEKDQAAEESTNPLPIKEQLKFKPMYTFPEGATRYKAELQFEPTLPYPGVIIPGLDVEELWSVARLQLTGESLQNANGTAGGLEDLNFVDLAATRWGSLTLAAGGATVFPLATSTQLGKGKWQVGPAVAFDFVPMPALRVAALTQGLWSVAGSSASPTLAYATVQPFITVRLPAALILSSDATMNFYWAGGSTTVPVNLGFGHAFSKWFVGTIKCQVTVAGPASDVGTIKGEVDLTFLP
jgi:hypothetical protein